MQEMEPMGQRELKHINYVGSSMNPLLKDGDGLHIVPYKDRAILPGDVIVFVPTGSEKKIVHRVVSVDARGVKTRGDNASTVDPWVLARDHILGRVVYAQRKNRKRSTVGGFPGRIVACSFHCMHRCGAGLSFLLRPVYHRLGRSASLRKTLRGLLKPRVLFFRRVEGMELHLVVRHCLIGRRLPGKEYWEIRRPFRLFVDEALLPKATPTEVTLSHAGSWPAHFGKEGHSQRNQTETTQV
jgi:signal peptidase I